MSNETEPNTIAVGELRVVAILENLRKISDFLRAIGEKLKLSDDMRFDMDLAVEEASANIVRHAYRPGEAGDLLVRVETFDDIVRISLTDWGLPFEPKNVAPFDPNATVETRSKGGTGLKLIYSLMEDVVRKTSPAPGGPNVLILSKHMDHRRAL